MIKAEQPEPSWTAPQLSSPASRVCLRLGHSGGSLAVSWELVRGGSASPAPDGPSGYLWVIGKMQRPHLRLLPHLAEMVPLSHLDDREQAPAPESLEVRHGAMGPTPVLFSFRADQAAMGRSGFAEGVRDWCWSCGCGARWGKSGCCAVEVGQGRAGGGTGKVFWRLCRSFLEGGHSLAKAQKLGHRVGEVWMREEVASGTRTWGLEELSPLFRGSGP